MRLRCWFAVPAVWIALATPLRADDPADRRALSGNWEGFIAEPRGERPGPVRFSEIRITPERIRGTQGDGRDMGEGTYQLGVAGTVRTLDSTGLSGEPRGKTFLGIYEIRGDTLRWCVANPGKPRPTEFASRPSSGQFLMVLTRKR
jgi:uncharacterized protein (TIGR03067 family)